MESPQIVTTRALNAPSWLMEVNYTRLICEVRATLGEVEARQAERGALTSSLRTPHWLREWHPSLSTVEYLSKKYIK